MRVDRVSPARHLPNREVKSDTSASHMLNCPLGYAGGAMEFLEAMKKGVRGDEKGLSRCNREQVHWNK
jgi:hypothetical protein